MIEVLEFSGGRNDGRYKTKFLNSQICYKSKTIKKSEELAISPWTAAIDLKGSDTGGWSQIPRPRLTQ